MFPNPFPNRRPPGQPPFLPPGQPGHNPGHNPPHSPHVPPTQPGRNDAPRTAPPDYVPNRARAARAVDPGAIRGCLHSFMYVWLTNGQAFWMYPTFVGRRSVSGFRWSRFGWVYTGFDLRLVESFFCTR